MRKLLTAAVGLLAGASTLALVGSAAQAATNEPIAATGGMESTINLLGVPLDVNVVLDTDTGDITSVEVLNNGQPADMTATKVTPTKVRFQSNTDGSTKVSVKAKGNSLSLGVRTDSLSKLLGTNTWAADVMGTTTDTGAAAGSSTTTATAGTGPKSKVTYTIGDAGDGTPTLKIDEIAPAAGVEATQLDSWDGGKHGDDDDEHASAGARIQFTQDGFKKILSIWVSVDRDDDSDGHASLHITLSGRNVQRKTLAELAGDKTWNGQLCDGTAGSIAYTVTPEGKVVVNSTSPDGATVSDSKNGVTVRFASGDKVSIRLVVPENGGDAALAINKSGRKCSGTRVTAADPTVNVSVATTTADQQNGGRNRNRSNDGTRTRDHKGNGQKGD